jgi:hypothetical protein
MGEPNNPCFKPDFPYTIWTENTTVSTTEQPLAAQDEDFFILPHSGIACPVISFNQDENSWEPSDIVPDEKLEFLCVSELYDPSYCYKIVDKYIPVADINVDTDICKRYKLKVIDIAIPTTTTTTTTTTTSTTTSTTSTLPPVSTTTTTTTTLDPLITGNSANYNDTARWRRYDDKYRGIDLDVTLNYSNVTTVGSNGGPSAYGTYDQSGNCLEWTDGDESSSQYLVWPPFRPIRGGFFLSGPPGYTSQFVNLNLSPLSISSQDRTIDTVFGRSGFARFAGFRVASAINPLNLPNFSFVGDINNHNDTSGYGSVGYIYRIGTYPVTNCEYAAFLNAVDPDGINPQNIYKNEMNSFVEGGIVFSNTAAKGSKYTTKINMDNKPVILLNWFDCARYCNWLHNGRKYYNTTNSSANAPQNQGAYNIGNLDFSTNAIAVKKEANAAYWIPTENEWYKAAYYKGGGINAGYWLYATQSNNLPVPVQASFTGDGLLNRTLIGINNYTCPATVSSVWMYPMGFSTTIEGATVFGSGTDWTIRLPDSATGLEGAYTLLINGARGQTQDGKYGFSLAQQRIQFQDGTFMDSIAALFCVITNLPGSSIFQNITLPQFIDFYNSATYINIFNDHIYYPERYFIPNHSSTIPNNILTSSSFGIIPPGPIKARSDTFGRTVIPLKFNKPVANFPITSFVLYWSWVGASTYQPLSYWENNLLPSQYQARVREFNFIDDYKNRILNNQ